MGHVYDEEYEARVANGYTGTAYAGFGEVTVNLDSGDAVLMIDGGQQAAWNIRE